MHAFLDGCKAVHLQKLPVSIIDHSDAVVILISLFEDDFYILILLLVHLNVVWPLKFLLFNRLLLFFLKRQVRFFLDLANICPDHWLIHHVRSMHF